MRIQPLTSRRSKTALRLLVLSATLGSVFAGMIPAAHALAYTSVYVRVGDNPNIDPAVALTNSQNALTTAYPGTSIRPALDGLEGYEAYVPTTGPAGTLPAGFTPPAGTRCWTIRFDTPTGTYDAVADPYSGYNAARAMGATSFWNAGYTGKNVDVAVIDTGVSPVGDLKNVVIHGPDFSFESQSPDLAHLDGFGHGTHMASLIHAVAPGARILSVKVGDSTGAADVTQVMAAVDWVREHRTSYGLNVRVINLSYGVVSAADWTKDDLSKSIDKAWADGIVVSVSAGNNGDAQFESGLTSPAYNMNVLSVGAYDTGTTAVSSTGAVYYNDDTLPSFSSDQSRSNPRLPDVGAPGVHVTGFRVPYSAADNAIADSLCSPSYAYPIFGAGAYLRGSGTSQASALASGAAALMLSRMPALTSDQVKRMLKANAHAIPNGQKSIYGDGAIDLKAVYSASVPSWVQNNDTVTGDDSSIEYLRGGAHLIDEQATSSTPITSPAGYIRDWCLSAPTSTSYGSQIPNVDAAGTKLCGSHDIFGKNMTWGGAPAPLWCMGKAYGMHASLVNCDGRVDSSGNKVGTWTDTAAGGTWDGVLLVAPPAATATGFLDDATLGKVWPSVAWSGTNWAGHAWITDNWTGYWDGNRWSGNRWSGNRWSGNRWSGNRWSGNTWRSNSWSSAGWR